MEYPGEGADPLPGAFGRGGSGIAPGWVARAAREAKRLSVCHLEIFVPISDGMIWKVLS